MTHTSFSFTSQGAQNKRRAFSASRRIRGHKWLYAGARRHDAGLPLSISAAADTVMARYLYFRRLSYAGDAEFTTPRRHWPRAV